MTEGEWLACTDPEKMLELLRGKVSDRKLRLFACACCSLVWDFIADDRNRRAVELAERLADGGAAKRNELDRVRAAARDGTAWNTIINYAWDAASHAARSGAGEAARSAIRNKVWGGREERDTAWHLTRAKARLTQAGILRDIFGPLLFRETGIHPVWLAWHNGLVVSMAQRIYEARDFSDIPVLADALTEAGCDNADILNHCRQPGLHVRGCWLIDALLGKS